MESYRFVVYGRVQGVYYRKSVAQRLRELGLQGYVRNLPDGTVEVVLRATEDELEAIEKALYEGSPLSEVERVVREPLEEENDILYDGFEIRY